MVTKKQSKRPPSITVFFNTDVDIHKQIVADAKTIGISASALAKLALGVGYPVVREKFLRELNPLKK
jgi:hypothetical protein